MPTNSNQVTRRNFVKATTAAAAFTVMKSETALTAQANSAMAIGLIGCGGRGNHDATNFRRHTNSRIVALSDPYQDRLDNTKRHFESDNPSTFQGFDAYQKLLNSEVDTVIITSPPYFHPLHFEAAVAAKKNVYLEKPVAVDTVGALRVLEAGKKADGNLSVMVGFQTRFSQDMQEGVKRVHDGEIGEIVCGQAHYHSGWLSPQHKAGMPEQEMRIRNWVFDIVLSGDILVEQNIHILDACNWIMQKHPIKAYGTGGRRIRTAVGDTWDHYGVTFWYPDNVELVFAATQFLDLGWGDAGERFNGAKGVFDSITQPVNIRGENAWEFKGEQDSSEIRKVQALYDSIDKKQYANEIPQGVESTLTAIMGRTAAYRKTEYTWKEMMDEKEELDAKLNL